MFFAGCTSPTQWQCRVTIAPRQHPWKRGQVRLPFLGLCAQRKEEKLAEETAFIERKAKNKQTKKARPPPQQRNRAPTPPWLHMWILASQLFAEPHSAEISGSLMHLEALLLLAIKIILRRQPCVFPWLLLLFFLFLFFSWWVILPACTLSSDRPDSEVTGVACEQNWPHYPQPPCLPCHW